MEKKNLPLTIALCVPFIMVGIIALSVAVPRFFFHPKTSVLFSTDPTFWGGGATFFVRDGRVEKNNITVSSATARAGYGEPRLWVYDPASDVSREISFEAAQALRLESSTRSPDGYEIGQGDAVDGLGLLFFMRSGEWGALTIQGKAASRKIKAPNATAYPYMNAMHFLGWIIGGN